MTESAKAGGGLSLAIRTLTPFPIEAGFSIAKGEIMALAGASGGGKTTILRTIAGFLAPMEGAITCGGAIWFDSARQINLAARHRRAGMVFQSYALFPHLTAAENIMEALSDLPAPRRRPEALALLARLHLNGLADRRPMQLSGGQQQRVALARALARRPLALLLDEPFSAVDRPTRDLLLRDLFELRRDLGLAVILVTHDLDEVARYADTIAFLAEGKILAHGPVGEVLNRPDLVGLTGGTEASSVISARIEAHDRNRGVTTLRHGAGKLYLPLVDRPIGSDLRLLLHARDVSLALGEIGRLSIRNRLAARIEKILPHAPPIVDVWLDAAGEKILARLTADAVADLGLQAGMAVTALIKSIAFERG